jgi:hypothetical protein
MEEKRVLNSLQTAKSLRTEEQRGRFELIVAASQGVTHYALGRHEPFEFDAVRRVVGRRCDVFTVVHYIPLNSLQRGKSSLHGGPA